jgi:hypothetical protein
LADADLAGARNNNFAVFFDADNGGAVPAGELGCFAHCLPRYLWGEYMVLTGVLQ